MHELQWLWYPTLFQELYEPHFNHVVDDMVVVSVTRMLVVLGGITNLLIHNKQRVRFSLVFHS